MPARRSAVTCRDLISYLKSIPEACMRCGFSGLVPVAAGIASHPDQLPNLA